MAERTWLGNSPLHTAALVLHVVKSKEAEGGRARSLTRVRISELTFRALSDRSRMSADFLAEVQEVLLKAGWVLFWSGSGYALVRKSAVDGWTRIAAKRIRDDLQDAKTGKFDWRTATRLLSDSSSQQADATEELDE